MVVKCATDVGGKAYLKMSSKGWIISTRYFEFWFCRLHVILREDKKFPIFPFPKLHIRLEHSGKNVSSNQLFSINPTNNKWNLCVGWYHFFQKLVHQFCSSFNICCGFVGRRFLKKFYEIPFTNKKVMAKNVQFCYCVSVPVRMSQHVRICVPFCVSVPICVSVPF